MSPIDPGAVVGQVIAAPVLTSVVSGDTKVTATFSSVAGALGYDLYWSTVAGVTKINSTKIAGATSPQDVTGLTNGIPVYVRVAAFDAETESDLSVDELSATPSAGVDFRDPRFGAGLTRGLSGF